MHIHMWHLHTHTHSHTQTCVSTRSSTPQPPLKQDLQATFGSSIVFFTNLLSVSYIIMAFANTHWREQSIIQSKISTQKAGYIAFLIPPLYPLLLTHADIPCPFLAAEVFSSLLPISAEALRSLWPFGIISPWGTDQPCGHSPVDTDPCVPRPVILSTLRNKIICFSRLELVALNNN